MTAKFTSCIPEGYSVDEMGFVYADTGWRGSERRVMSTSLNSHGYPSVRMVFSDGTRKRIAIHRMVAEAFLPLRPSLQHEVRHLNGDKEDNRADNLAWGTKRDNALDRSAHGHAYRPNWNDPEVRARMQGPMKGAKSRKAVREASCQI